MSTYLRHFFVAQGTRDAPATTPALRHALRHADLDAAPDTAPGTMQRRGAAGEAGCSSPAVVALSRPHGAHARPPRPPTEDIPMSARWDNLLQPSRGVCCGRVVGPQRIAHHAPRTLGESGCPLQSFGGRVIPHICEGSLR